jgi:hypothetical protein
MLNCRNPSITVCLSPHIRHDCLARPPCMARSHRMEIRKRQISLQNVCPQNRHNATGAVSPLSRPSASSCASLYPR